MTALFALPKPKMDGIGHLTYRCHGCGELIDGDFAWVSRDASGIGHPIQLDETTKTYHKDHLPPE